MEASWVFWGLLVVTSAFAEVELVYERATKTPGTFRDVIFYLGAKSVTDR